MCTRRKRLSLKHNNNSNNRPNRIIIIYTYNIRYYTKSRGGVCGTRKNDSPNRLRESRRRRVVSVYCQSFAARTIMRRRVRRLYKII